MPAKKRPSISGADHLYRGQLDFKLAASNRQISAKQLYLRFAAVIHADPAKLNLSDKVGKWINPWPGFAPAFVSYVNKFPAYVSDGMQLTLKDISKAVLIADVGDAIASRYVRNGWTIT